jgi:hypothetical protein
MDAIILARPSARCERMFPMLVRDVLLTLAADEFFSPKWSPRIGLLVASRSGPMVL